MACLEAGEAGSHGFALAKAITDAGDSRELTATGTMYRALHRLDAAGLVESWWEDPHDAADAGRPRRRAATIAIAAVAVLFFWLGAWPVTLVAVIGSTIDLATRTPNRTPLP